MTADPFEDIFGATEETTKFYPGSKRVRRAVAEPEKFTPKKSDEDAWDSRPQMKRLPNGETVEMFTAGALAAALERPLVTLRKWERDGNIPQAPYRFRESVVAGERKPGRRLYTRALIEATVEAFAKRGLIGKERIEWSRHQDLPLELVETWKKIHDLETSK